MDDIAGIMFGTHTVAYFVYFIGTEISHTAHPHSEAPERRHRRISGQVTVAAKYLFHRIAGNDKCIQHSLIAQELYGAGGMSRQRKFAVGAGMVKSPVHPAGEIERYILIGTPVIYSLPILILEEKRLSAQVHFEETLSGSCKAFIRPALERKGGTFLFARPFAEGNGQSVIAGRREMIVCCQADFPFAVRIQSDVQCFLRIGQ